MRPIFKLVLGGLALGGLSAFALGPILGAEPTTWHDQARSAAIADDNGLTPESTNAEVETEARRVCDVFGEQWRQAATATEPYELERATLAELASASPTGNAEETGRQLDRLMTNTCPGRHAGALILIGERPAPTFANLGQRHRASTE